MPRLKNDFYHYLAERLYDRGEKEGRIIKIQRKNAKEIIAITRISKKYTDIFLDNMEKLGLIKKQNKRVIKILVK